VATGGGAGAAGPTARSSALLSDLLAETPGAAASAVVERHLELTATLLGRDWLTLLDHVRGRDGTLPAAVAWRAGYALHHLGHLSGALTTTAAAGSGAASVEGSGGGAGDEADRARLAAVRSSTSWARGDLEACRTFADEAAVLAEAAADPGARAAAYVARAMLAAFDGDRDLNLHSYERALVLAVEAGDLQTTERVHNNLGSRCLDEGRCTEALEHLQRGLEANERTGHLSGLAILRHNVAEALLGLGRLDEALVECDASRDLWTSIEAPGASGSWQLRGEIQLARGNAGQAAMAFAHAAALAEREDNAQYHSVAVAGEARALVATDPTRAAVLARQATSLAVPVAHAAPVLAAGWVHLALGDPAHAAELAERGTGLAGRHRDLPRLADALELAALAARAADGETPTTDVDPRLREAGDIWRDLGNPVRVLTHEVVVAHVRRDRLTGSVARAELRSLGVHDDVWRVAGPLHAVARPAPADDVQVRVLGPFGVEVGGVALPASAWPSRKAREVLGVLACRGERGLGRERLGALVWPDAGAVGNRLSVALSHVRSVLDPDRRLPGSPVLSDGGTVRLDLHHVSVDLVDFTAAAHAALAAARAGSPRGVPLLQGAAALHTGRLLEDAETPGDAEWLSAQREEVELLGQEVLQALARTLAEGPEPAEALHWHARLLAHDPYDEATYADLVALLVRLGRYGEARRHHRTYVLRMDELGVPARTWSELAGA